MKNSKNIDVLNLYHMRPFAQIMIFLYKLLNRNGKVYLKLDSSYVKFSNYKLINNKWIVKQTIKKCALVSCESKKASDLFKKDELNIEYIPNGFLNNNDNNLKKEKIILTVGRLGTEQKATEILLETFKILKEKYHSHYRLILIGTMEEEFKEKYKKFLKENPNITKYIDYIGEIEDRKELENYYKKVVFLPNFEI